jgi:hypothetical protein
MQMCAILSVQKLRKMVKHPIRAGLLDKLINVREHACFISTGFDLP